MMPLTIFYNEHYSQTRHTFANLRGNRDRWPVRLIGSHRDAESPMLRAADIAIVEPSEDAGYVDWLFERCAEHHVDVLVPHRGRLDVARRRRDFERAGTAVLLMPQRAIELANDKLATYQCVARDGVQTPPHQLVTSASELEACIQSLGSEALISKPRNGEAEKAYRQILTAEWPCGAEGLQRPHISVAELRQELQSGQWPDGLIVMPYMDEPEISIDVLAQDGLLLAAIPRVKGLHERKLLNDPGVTNLAVRITKLMGLDALANIQLRFYRGEPLLLEVNPRSAAGAYQARLSGVDVDWEAIRIAAGEPVRPLAPKLGIRYTVSPTEELTVMSPRSTATSMTSSVGHDTHGQTLS